MADAPSATGLGPAFAALRAPLAQARAQLGLVPAAQSDGAAGAAPHTHTQQHVGTRQDEVLLRFLALLARWNRSYKLTAITEPTQMLRQHLLDSLAALPALHRVYGGWNVLSTPPAEPESESEAEAAQETESTSKTHPAGAPPERAPATHTAPTSLRVLDVGSGGGLPGIPWAVLCPGVQFTLLECNHKKAAFLRQAALELPLPNVTVCAERIENLARHPRYTANEAGCAPMDRPPYNPGFCPATVPAPRGYGLITARAFATLANLVVASRPLLAPGGRWLALKGAVPEAEIAALPSWAQVVQIETLQVPGLDARRCLVWIEMRP